MAASNCPNCGTSLVVDTRYCSACGQEQRERVVPVGQMLLDILRDNFAFDSKVFRSLPKLLFKPGHLTAEFVAGRHVRYIPPVRLYVFISVVAFLIFSFPTKDSFVQDGRLIDNEKPGVTISGMDGALAEVDSMGVEAWKRAHLDQGDLADRFGSKLILVNHQGLMPVVLERYRRQLPLPLLLIVPLVALVLKLLFWKAYYVVHLVTAFHWAAFVLLAFALLHMVDVALGTGIAIAAGIQGLVHIVLALRKVHAIGWLRSLLSGLVVSAVAVVLLAATMFATMVVVLEQM
ncbi:MAG: DUF3667 domain-containing protein [Flavobacteriales bacterium]|nr:DUF3667 domain-containing protein [Flavobacteriales bacterium]HPF68710.1 DUF3667 domain-containing protein [Flavobacteriales bacterium]HPJ52937.1 DUF3667 domain-containing protein [Flavobacteriales bacterium]